MDDKTPSTPIHSDKGAVGGDFRPIEKIPADELSRRHGLVRRFLADVAPDAGGILVFSRVNIYYLSGTLAAGIFWLPLEGEPVLLLRRGAGRARLESTIEHQGTYRSFGDAARTLSDFGSPLAGKIACEMDGLPWSLGAKLEKSFKDVEMAPGGQALLMARSRKTDWELAKMRRAGEMHKACLERLLPDRIRPGMTERDCAVKAWELFFQHGHSGLMRMGAFGEEIFLGHVSAGDSGNYPSAFNGPLGLRGDSPAVPFMGNANIIWDGERPLSCDIGFNFEGYHTDKTSVYWGPDGEIPAEAARAHDFCVRVQNWVAENAVPGATPADLYRPCAEWAAKEGFENGFMALDENKVPFVGHGIGLVIDEYPPLAERFDEPLEAGMCLAVEPKIGIPGLGMVGTENTFEVREGGAICLTGENFEILRTHRY